MLGDYSSATLSASTDAAFSISTAADSDAAAVPQFHPAPPDNDVCPAWAAGLPAALWRQPDNYTLPAGHARSYFDLLRFVKPWEPPAEPAAAAEQQQEATTAHELMICKALQIDVLGRFADGSVKIFSIFHRRSSVIKQPDKISYEMFTQICGPPAKACLLKSRVDDGIPGMYGVDDARTAVNLLAGYRTLSDEIQLGAGCWLVKEECEADEQKIVMVNGNEAAIHNGILSRVDHPRACGALLDFAGGKPWYDFDTLKANLERAADKGFRMAAYGEVAEILTRWRWQRAEASPPLVIGLILATWVQQIWNWRPQVAIIGESKTGKSFMCDFLSRLFAPNCILTSDTTAAGLRQTIENSMPAVIVDEADTKDRSQQEERRKILGMIRQSSRGGTILRGTSGQRKVQHRLQHIFWQFGISLSLDDAADANRVVKLELLPPARSDEGKLHIPSPKDCHDLGQRLLAIALWAAKRSRIAVDAIREMKVPGIDSRVIESYAVPTAILAAVHGFDQPAAQEGLLRELLAGIEEDQPAPQHDDLISEIKTAKIRVANETLTVGQCIEAIELMQPIKEFAIKALATNGIRLKGFGPDQCLWLQFKPVKTLLKGTQFHGQPIEQILPRIPGAEKCNMTIGGTTSRGIVIPYARSVAQEPEETGF